MSTTQNILLSFLKRKKTAIMNLRPKTLSNKLTSTGT